MTKKPRISRLFYYGGTIKKPNIVFVFGDEWRAQAVGYAGDPNCETPVSDKLASQSINCTTAISGCSVCCPYRASLLTGQYPLSHGVVINDMELSPDCYSIADAFNDGGYQTAYIGKWHVYGSPDGKYGRRKSFVPRNYQLRFDYWKGFECTHDYNDSYYFFNEDPTPRKWDGYDAFSQTEDAVAFIKEHATARYTYIRDTNGPWLLFDNEKDPYQMKNLIGRPEAVKLQDKLEAQLGAKLKTVGDEFLDGNAYMNKFNVHHYMETRSPNPRNWEYPWDAVTQK